MTSNPLHRLAAAALRAAQGHYGGSGPNVWRRFGLALDTLTKDDLPVRNAAFAALAMTSYKPTDFDPPGGGGWVALDLACDEACTSLLGP